jgi:hypothetical protein
MTPARCTCYVRGDRDETPRKRLLPHRVVRFSSRPPVYLPSVETDDPRCPVHGIAGRKIMRPIAR